MTPTIDMADTGHNTDNTDFLGHRLFSSLSSTTSYHPDYYLASQIQQMEIPITGIDLVLSTLTLTSQRMEYPVNNQGWIVMDSVTTGTDAWGNSAGVSDARHIYVVP